MTRWILLCMLFTTIIAPAQKPRTVRIGSNEIQIMDGYAYINGDKDSVSVYVDTFSNGQIRTMSFFPWSDSDLLSVTRRYKLVSGFSCLPCEYVVSHKGGSPEGAYSAMAWGREIGFDYTWYENGSAHISYDVMPDSAGGYWITEYTHVWEDSFLINIDSLDRIMHLHLTPHAMNSYTGLDYDIELEGVCSTFDHFNKIRRDLWYRKSKLYKEDIYRRGAKVQTVIYDKE